MTMHVYIHVYIFIFKPKIKLFIKFYFKYFTNVCKRTNNLNPYNASATVCKRLKMVIIFFLP